MNRLISYAYLKEETDIPKIVGNEKLDNPIKWAQDQLNFVLGSLFYDQLYSQGSTTPTTFSTANAAFFDPFVKQFLAWTAYHDFVIRSNFYDSRNGPRAWREENSDPVDSGTMNMLVKKAAEKVQFYKGNMINYLLEQQQTSSSNFPLYKPNCSYNMGTGFGISGVTRKDTRQTKTTQRTIQNGD